MLRSALLILTGNAASALLTLARNLIVARMISAEHYGIAATFAIAVSVAEMMSNLGLQQQIVQARTGDDTRFQAGVQGFSVLRGLLAGVGLFLLAAPLTAFLNIEGVTWAFQAMALVPILNACVHFDIHRMTRQMHFWPLILTGTVPPLLAVVALWPLSVWFGDYRIMLYSILIQSVLAVATSHLTARRPYRVSLDTEIIKQSFSFGWPLLVNGILLFIVFQGDKLIVGRELGMATLAIFAMGYTLTLTPTLLIAKSAQNFFLPQLSDAHRNGTAMDAPFDHLARTVIQVGLLNGVLLVLGVSLLGPPLVSFLLGEKYAALLPLLTWLAILQAFRVFKSGSSIVALARGQTSNATIANLMRVLALPVAWYALVKGGDLLTVIWIATLGEIAGFAVSLLLLQWRLNVGLSGTAASFACTLFVLGIAAGSAYFGASLSPTLFLIALFVASGILVWSMADLRLYVRRSGVV